MGITIEKQSEFPCKRCGATLVFAPGQTALKCPYCATENRVAASAQPIEELDFRASLADATSAEETQESLVIHCSACGAESSLAVNVTADRCPFCGAAIVAEAKSHKQIRPRSLLPFHIREQEAKQAFAAWVASLWFAPGDLARYAEAGGLKGVYIPYWTYDSDTFSRYSGERGDDYWVTESYTAIENGKSVTRSRQVQKTRWHAVSGSVENSFDDVLILASESLPRKYTEKLEPWDLKNLTGYADEYLAGFVAESYQIGLEQGFERAKEKMDPVIRQSICSDIGGDHQRIHSLDTRYSNTTFKHILLPLWISAYRYRDRAFRFLVNARTGEVGGERPWSTAKIVSAVLVAVAIVIAIVLLVSSR